MRSTDTDRYPVRAGDKIIFSLSQIKSASAATPIVMGFKKEEDPDFKARRNRELSSASVKNTAYLQRAIESVPGVISCSIAVNFGPKTDPSGRPPNSIQISVFGGSDEQIAQAILESVAPGTTMIGAPVQIFDDQGTERIIRFSRVSQVPVYLIVNLYFESGKAPKSEAKKDEIRKKVRQSLSQTLLSLKQGEDVATTPYLQGALSFIPGLIGTIVRVKKDDTEFSKTLPINDLEIARPAENFLPDSSILIAGAPNKNILSVPINLELSLAVDSSFQDVTAVKSLIVRNISNIQSGNVSQFSTLSGIDTIPGALYVKSFQVNRKDIELSGKQHISFDKNETPTINENDIKITVEAENG